MTLPSQRTTRTINTAAGAPARKLIVKPAQLPSSAVTCFGLLLDDVEPTAPTESATTRGAPMLKRVIIAHLHTNGAQEFLPGS